MPTPANVLDRVPVRPETILDTTPPENEWPGEPGSAPLPRRVARTLLLLAPLNADAGMLSLAVLSDGFSCGSPICTATTLGRHPALVLALSVIYLTALTIVAALTRWLTEASTPLLAV